MQSVGKASTSRRIAELIWPAQALGVAVMERPAQVMGFAVMERPAQAVGVNVMKCICATHFLQLTVCMAHREHRSKDAGGKERELQPSSSHKHRSSSKGG